MASCTYYYGKWQWALWPWSIDTGYGSVRGLSPKKGISGPLSIFVLFHRVFFTSSRPHHIISTFVYLPSSSTDRQALFYDGVVHVDEGSDGLWSSLCTNFSSTWSHNHFRGSPAWVSLFIGFGAFSYFYIVSCTTALRFSCAKKFNASRPPASSSAGGDKT